MKESPSERRRENILRKSDRKRSISREKGSAAWHGGKEGKMEKGNTDRGINEEINGRKREKRKNRSKEERKRKNNGEINAERTKLDTKKKTKKETLII